MSTQISISPPPATRRKNLRLALILCLAMAAIAAWTPWFVRHGWIYPQDVTYAFPHW